MRQAILFYSFMVIFVVTAIVTLLGVVGKITIPVTQLNMLLGAFLVGLAGAVVALYRRTDFFDRSSDNLAISLGGAIEAFDRISDEIEAAIKNKLPDPNHVHRFLILRARDRVVAYEKMRVLTAEELKDLPKKARTRIEDYENSMKKLAKEWSRIKRSGTAQLNPEVRERNLTLLKTLKEDIVELLDFLQSKGIYLDDHYDEVRTLVANL